MHIIRPILLHLCVELIISEASHIPYSEANKHLSGTARKAGLVAALHTLALIEFNHHRSEHVPRSS